MTELVYCDLNRVILLCTNIGAQSKTCACEFNYSKEDVRFLSKITCNSKGIDRKLQDLGGYYLWIMTRYKMI